MFGVFSRFLGHLWEGVFPEEKENGATESNDEVLAKNGRQTGCETQRGNFGSSVASHELRKCFSGKVTKVYDDSGMIDEEVFFKFNQVIGGIRPKLGAEVYGEAWRESADDGWRATRVEVVMSEWNSFGEEGTREVLIGEVTGITEENIIVNFDVYCKVSSLTVGYVACKGDWVRVELLRDRGVVCEVESVRPLREKTETAYITSVTHGHGYINTDIFFSFGACKKSYVPRKGHTVQVTAIESKQGNCKWRALRVEPKIPRQKLSNLNLLRTIANQESKFTKELLCDKQGVTITDQINFGDVTVGETQKRLVCIRNNGANMVILKCVEGLAQDSIFWIEPMGKENLVCSDNTECETAGSSMKQALNIEITPQNMLELNITVSSRFLGEMNQLVVFNFGTFQIGRYFIANVQDAQQQLLNVRVPFHRQKFVDQKNALTRVLDTRNNQQWVIPGDRPMFKQPTIINISCKLRQYEIPRMLRQYILDKMDLCCLVPSLGEPLLMRNYKERFSALLHAEEVQMELEMREFDMEQVSLNDAGELLSLSVPGLAEGRPSLLIGDRVILSVSAASQNCPKYEGFIHEVLNDAILLKFHDDFHTTYDMDCYDVMFFFNRAPLRRAHRAIEMAKYLGDQVLFPTRVVSALPQILCKSKAKNGLYNEKLNERQKAAVSRILSGQCRPMPYVLFGPPGTGKTVTLVEAILQVFHRISFSRILACTPSNSAADLIAERLHHSGGIGEGDMVRLNAFQRQQNIPDDIENYSANIEKLDMAAHYRIVICTCTTAGQLHTLGLPTGHFTHVFIDEAGQATEPESLVPISFLAGTDGQIILGGDPYQLGAVLRSEISQSYGLDISLLERLMNCYPYQRDEEKFSDHGCYDPLTVTKLINNYRSHEALLELPSRLFYHAEMVPCVQESVKNCLRDWKSLPNGKGFPIIFHGVKGEDLREGNSPSWFNAVEAVQVIRYVQELRSFKKYEVKLTDIGIITPYRKQVEKIRLLLERLGLNEIKVGSVEEFQGQERLVIIISTVRSRSSLLGLDVAHNLGFVSNPKRFNVAITRAQALMILIGNPHILSKDVNWRALLKYCVDNNGYIGCDLPRLDEVVEDAYGESVDMEGHDGLSDSNDEPSRPDVDSLQSVPNQFLGNVGNTHSLCDDGKEAEWLNRSNYNAADEQKKNVVRKTRSKVEDKSFAYEIRSEPARDNLDQEGKFVTNTTLFVDNRETKGDYVRDYSMYKTRDMKVNCEWQVSGKEDVSESTHEKTTRLVLHNAKRTSSTSLNRQRMTADENIDFNQETAIPTLPKATRTDSIQDPINHSSDEDLEEIVYIPDPQR